ncbi:MAG: ECF transporter S component [Thermoanaerobacteraceae bacterium]|nr:ECF transporter S component [Thermoanaerobacteraceae bacterium]
MINQKTKMLTLMGLFVALSAVGALIKVPSPTGTVAFDSAPGFVAALLLGPGPGAFAAAFGHLFSSLFAGFPMTLPIHTVIALEMAAFAAIYGYMGKKNLTMGVIAVSLLNGIIAPATFIPMPQFGIAFFTAMLFPLLVASAANVIVSALIYKAIVGISRSKTYNS